MLAPFLAPPTVTLWLHGCRCTVNALEIVQQLVRQRGLEDEKLTLVSHHAGGGWRQRYRTAEERIDHPLSGGQLLALGMGDLDRIGAGGDRVVSISSRLRGRAGDRHLALMDLCPGVYAPLSRVEADVREICGQRGIWLLRSGRHYHVYGDFLLDETGWWHWNVQFLLPSGLVDSRYIGCSLLWGANLLRLNAGRRSLTTVPAVAAEQPEAVSGETATRARQLAERLHGRQLRKSGEPMLNHLREVAELAVQIYDECLGPGGSPSEGDASPEELYACGYLHDSVEDTSTDYEDVERVAGRRVADWVAVLSHDKRLPQVERNGRYENQIAAAGLVPRVVKLADLLSNLRGLRGTEEPDWILRYLAVAERQLALISRGLDRCGSMVEARDHILRWRRRLTSAN